MATAHRRLAASLHRPRNATIGRGLPLSIARMIAQATLFVGFLLLNKAGLPGTLIFFGGLLVMAASSSALAFQALSIGFLGLMCNQSIVPKTPAWTIARFLIPAACLLRFSFDLQSLRTSLFSKRYYSALLAFIIVAALLSIMSNYFVEIALLKLLNFFIVTTAILAGAHVLRCRRTDLTEWYVMLCLVTAVLGAGSLVAGIGYNMRGAGVSSSTFNGPFYHSNCLGPIAAMMVVYLTCVSLFGKYRNRWVCVAIAACLVYFMGLTLSRTAFASMFVGIIVVISLSLFFVRRGAIYVSMNVSRATLVGVVALAGIGLLTADAATDRGLTKRAIAFANKGGKSEVIDFEQVMSSRQAIIDAEWRNFQESPLIGIGFEVAKTELFQRTANLFYAPIEKGFLPVAVLEETGIIGALFFSIFLAAYLFSLWTALNIPGIALFLTFLAVNCGEAMFFAVAGHGGFGWLLFVGGMMLGNQCVVRAPENPLTVRSAYA